ncbi:unnamed protein product [Paramecium primaurelia]|uniref:Uncharacterized protein n=1 Tax=Paramecium primaurelia TaxID=5886 RepID=A0A8S1QNI3_PARPR|nr:unnamed protein product [Paramecium primaurelia]
MLTYLAKDGPYKATTVGTIKGACAERVFTEAPNNLTTDVDCQKYKNINVKSLLKKLHANQNQNVHGLIGVHLLVIHVLLIKILITQCVPILKQMVFCACQKSNSTCKAQVYEDQPATITSYAQCQSFADICTTTGAACIAISTFSLQKTQTILQLLQQLKIDRARGCSYKNGLNDGECNTFLSGCKANGPGCVIGYHILNSLISNSAFNLNLDHVFGLMDNVMTDVKMQ